MTKDQKNQEIADLVEMLSNASIFYLTDTASLNAEQTSKLRRECFKNNVGMRVVKNTLLHKALERIEGKDFAPLFETLKGNTAVMTAEVANTPARLIKEFRKSSDRPILKGAFIMEDCYVGDNQLDALVAIKSKEELVGEIIGLLQSPARNVISALQGNAGQKVAGLVKALEERGA
jgi:large subunit ribosomal protein L10